ncbi:hypothetical protein SISSUDRAFT_1053815 [Sistotremastrum suecicum HHB10207 ss-3]|uniref:Uncharacterized protein n=1 Tax=Sistotremastrum suecicum HHB10207 ss-3 TaxID=1314776 RepID=A0A165YZD1_9AGAM|nr:hypothetical protein SISSUDRAFT_1053815 [Sistotremastrum suecicum HHB10207 ss-3]
MIFKFDPDEDGEEVGDEVAAESMDGPAMTVGAVTRRTLECQRPFRPHCELHNRQLLREVHMKSSRYLNGQYRRVVRWMLTYAMPTVTVWVVVAYVSV